MPDFTLEDAARAEGYAVIAGVDEAGRGPWAGPVVAGAAGGGVGGGPRGLLGGAGV
ncbi:MAG: hypothetical protein H8E30_16735 [Alphaproteobacteria bacterium]|nr:hypothetical protein [Alphaproteobacteria bacterium]